MLGLRLQDPMQLVLALLRLRVLRSITVSPASASASMSLHRPVTDEVVPRAQDLVTLRECRQCALED